MIALFTLIQLGAQETEIYNRIRIPLENQSLAQLAASGIDLTDGYLKPGIYFQTEVSESQIQKLNENAISFEVLITDMAKFYADRYAAEKSTEINRNPADEYPVPANWEYGSMGGFYTYDEALAELDYMAQHWPNLITFRQAINSDIPTTNGNQIWWLRLSDNPGEDESEPEVLYTGVHHAREGIGVQQLIFYMYYLLENYETNEEIRTLVNNTEMYFVPIINPDGYKYNQQTNPNGGGMWRKNRRNNGGTYGVDINRNYGYMWGYDNDGSSPYPGDETYRGTAAFSEPENQNIKQFCEEHDFKIALNYHSAAGLLLYAWGWTPELCEDDAIFNAHSIMMTQDNNYVHGPGCTTIYATNGGSDDWMYGDTENKNKIFAYTPEVGTSNDGFWPPQNRIIPQCQENMIQDLMAAYLAGNYGSLRETSPTIINEKEGYFHFNVQRLGFGETDSWTVSITPLDENIELTGGPVSFGSLAMLETKTDSISYMLRNDIWSGDTIHFLLSLDNGAYIISDTITKMYGTTTTVFIDSCDVMDNWTSAKWSVTQASYHTPTGSITDSRNGDYSDNESNVVTMINPVEIPETSYAQLNFWAKWSLESGYDFVQVQVRVEGASSWTTLTGKYSKTDASGGGYWDGFVDWVNEEIDLTAYSGQSIKLRFRLISDSGVTEDGYYFDDMKITVLDVETGLTENLQSTNTITSRPNPANGMVEFSFAERTSANATLDIVDLQGRTVKNLDAGLTTKLRQDVSDLPAGMYLIRLTDNGTSLFNKLIVR